MLNEEELFGPHGTSALWRRHLEQPVEFDLQGQHDELYKIECPTGSGRELNLLEVDTELAARLASS